jgi:hypothetical protein
MLRMKDEKEALKGYVQGRKPVGRPRGSLTGVD